MFKIIIYEDENDVLKLIKNNFKIYTYFARKN
jgi:hypothetical protein